MSERRNYTELGLLLDSDPEKAARKIERTLKRTKGNASEAARRLGVPYRTLTRYFAKLRDQDLPVRDAAMKNRSELTELARKDPEAAAQKIRAELERSPVVQKFAAEKIAAKGLGVSWRTLHRCIARLAEAGHPVRV